MERYSSFLFARPSFMEGMARFVDMGGTLNTYNCSENADRLAIAADWKAVGSDLARAIERLAKEIKEHIARGQTKEIGTSSANRASRRARG